MALPNIVFVICDDLGINDLHCYGRQDHRTPNLDRLASEGVRFTSAYCSQPICSASRAGLLTGLNPARLHLTTFLPGRRDCSSQRVLHPEIMQHIPLETKTFPRFFKEAGYVTGFVGKWHVGGDGFGPADHGFEHVYYPGNSKNTIPSETEGGKAEYELTREALRFIEKNQKRPFVLYLAHYTPHIPYTAQRQRIAANRDAFEPTYAALIETLDDTVGILTAKLEDLSLAKDTIFVFTSDNGGLHVPEGEHIRVTHNTPYRAGKGYVYEGGMRVPTIVRWPARIPAGDVTAAPVMNTDWIPTLLELAGKSVPSGLDGMSFAEGLTNGIFHERPLFWHFPHYTNQGGRPSGAMRNGDWLLVEFYDENEAELYNLSEDIEEECDLAAVYPERLVSMQTTLNNWREQNQVQLNVQNQACVEEKFQLLYKKIDASRFDPSNANALEWRQIQEWRELMDQAIKEK